MLYKALIASLLVLVSLQTYRIRRLARERERYRLLSITDSLTGLANWRHALAIGQELIERGSAIGILILDLDRFKEINDTFGHIVGNKALVQVAHLLREAVSSEQGMVCRLGGDEFVIILPDCQQTEVHRVREQLIDKLDRAFKVDPDLPPIMVSVSIGVAYSPARAVTGFEDLIHIADKRMYDRKTSVLD